MQVDEASRHGEPEAEAAAAPGEGAVGLRERIEQAPEHLGVHADPRVADRQDRRGALLVQAEAHPPPQVGELEGVVEDAAEDLAQPDAVAVDPQGILRQADLEADLRLLEACPGVLGDLAGEPTQVHVLLLQRDLAAHQARHVEQAVDQADQVLDLALQHLPGGLDGGEVAGAQAQHVERVRDRRQRPAQLVAEHHQELVPGPPLRLGPPEGALAGHGTRAGPRLVRLLVAPLVFRSGPRPLPQGRPGRRGEP